MRITKTRTAAAILAMTFSVTGCAAFERVRGYTDSEYSVEVETKSSMLESLTRQKEETLREIEELEYRRAELIDKKSFGKSTNSSGSTAPGIQSVTVPYCRFLTTAKTRSAQRLRNAILRDSTKNSSRN